jgi:lysophospholipase L1-like esterase
VTVNLLVTAALLEIALRVQQKIGPLYDLDVVPEAFLVDASDELNHVHPPGTEWDSNGIRRMDAPNSESCAPRLLFMGDSFMQGLGPRDTIPYHARGALRQLWGKDVCVLNAGASSYSPSIYVVQAKKLMPLLKPDLVIIDVDETDIYDEWYRYRDLVVRDDTGSITAVRHTPLTSRFQQGLLESTNKLLYLHRLVAKLYFTKIEYPRLYAEYRKNEVVPIFMSNLPKEEIRKTYADQVEYFMARLEDLTQTVLRLADSADKLVYIHHPHLQHLEASPGRYNNIVSEALREVAARHHVRYYDAADDLQVEFGGTPENYYLPNDMHLNAAGLRAYGVAVAKYLAKLQTKYP